MLTTDTGHIRSYATDPYGNYYTEPRIMFPVEHNDDRLDPKEIIIGFNQGDIYKAYKQNDVESEILINDFIGDTPVVLVSLFSENSRVFERIVNGSTLDSVYDDGKVLDVQTNSEWNYDGLSVSGENDGMPVQGGLMDGRLGTLEPGQKCLTYGNTAATSFFSFFSLLPLGCCGWWWLYALSLLPSIVGTGVSAILIEYSQVLAYVGLIIIFGFTGLTVYKLKQEQKLQKTI